MTHTRVGVSVFWSIDVLVCRRFSMSKFCLPTLCFVDVWPDTNHEIDNFVNDKNKQYSILVTDIIQIERKIIFKWNNLCFQPSKRTVICKMPHRMDSDYG